jgi:NitT/TauT family transport system substrate-binding protein
MTRTTALLVAAAIGAATLAQAPRAAAQDKLKLAIGQRGNWDTAISHVGEKAGIFKKHGIELDMTYTSGSGETLQPVISNSVDIGLAIGTMGAISAYGKGAPVRVIGAEATGAADYWYAKADSGIKTLQDANGKTIAFSSRGSSTNSIVLAFINEFKLTAKPQATGSPPATLTAVMTGQVDVGWAAPPFGLKEMDEGKINLVAKATDAKIVAGQTIRVIAVNTETLAKKRDALVRYLQAYRETIAYMYSSDQAIKDYAEFAKIDETMARRVRDQFFPRAIVDPDAIKGLDTLLPEAVTLKFIDKELSKEQQAELFQVPLRK